jgi:transcriptional regulator with XRE-family HTH domain
MTHESLARKLRILRAARGITLAEAEELTGVTRETLGALEHGQRGAYTSTLEKIARGYGVTVSALLSEVEEPEAELALAGSSPGKVEAPREAGRLSAIDVAKDAARRQIALEKQAMFGGQGEVALDQRHANDAMQRLREEYGLDANDAEALVEFALQDARRREENAQLRQENAQLRSEAERKSAHR